MIHLYEELGDTSRRRLLGELRTGPKTVSELVETTLLKQPNVSNHLSRMKAKGLLRAQKVGRQVFYAFASPQIEAAVKAAFATRDVAETTLDVEDASKRYAKAAIQGNDAVCQEIVEMALRQRMSLLDIYQNLLMPAMVAIGTWYKVDAIDTAQEHLASSITERMMARVVQNAVPLRQVGRTALLGCGPQSWHVIGIRMVADYLHVAGWKTLFLGANMPHKCFLSSVGQHNPDLILVSCVCSDSVECATELVKDLNEARTPKRRYVIGVGGPSACENKQMFLDSGASFTCSNLRTFAEVILPEIEQTGTYQNK